MKKQKRVNPHRVPVSRELIDEDRLIEEASVGNLYYAWLLLLPSLFDFEGMTNARIAEIWDAINEYVSISRLESSADMKRAETLTGMKQPHHSISLEQVRTMGGLQTAMRKLRENAIFSALCLICLGLDSMKLLGSDEIRKLFLNADITIAEIQKGCNSYSAISDSLKTRGITISDSSDDTLAVIFEDR
ncbi:MAG: hypothetical protein J5449_01675 [Oscillospiraceae bacterium]|nr:hypothetical protein [Oscillospiraceae bacterium]